MTNYLRVGVPITKKIRSLTAGEKKWRNYTWTCLGGWGVGGDVKKTLTLTVKFIHTQDAQVHII